MACAAAMLLLSCGARGTVDAPPSFDPDSLPGADRPSQAAALEDGVVTFEEYEAAVRATMTCMEDRGVAVEGPHRLERRGIPFLEFSYGGVEARDDLAELESVYEACSLEYLSAVGDAYAYQHRPTARERARQDGLIVECLRRHGVDVDRDSTPAELDAALDASEHSGECLAEVVDIMNDEAGTRP